MRIIPAFLLCFFILSIEAKEELLEKNDISKIMQQILEHHVSKKEITSKVFKNALVIFINQFDPQRIYLLEDEIRPYVDLSDEDSQKLIDQYKAKDYSVFAKLNKLFQDAIERSRRLRRGIEGDAKEFLFQVKPQKTPASTPLTTFAKTIPELKERIFKNLELFVDIQRQRFSDALIAQKKDATIHAYEDHLRTFENQYLYVDDKGNPLPQAEQENLFAIHVLKALASSLDAHTTFYQTNEAYDLRVILKKEFPGVGIVFKDNPEGITVSSLLENGAAKKSGQVQIGDILLEINGVSIADKPFEKTMELLHEDNQAEINLTFKRKGENEQPDQIVKVNLQREKIVIKNDRVDTSYENFGNGIIGKITLHAFYQGDGITSEKDVKDAIDQLKQKGNIKGLILDLRDNSGGFLSQAVKVAGLFITNGVIVISKYANGDEKIYRDVDGKAAYDGPLVVLTSKTTASAAEIVSQALQDYGVALVVGDEHTYGKGSIQTQTVTEGQTAGSYFKVTVGKYYTVSGKTPQKEGVKADIVVPSHWNKEKIGEEYLDKTPSDRIPPAYNDDLKDISPDVKSWYLKYYVPKLQKKITEWRDLIPTLKKNSEYRITNNKDYQFYLKGKEDKEEELTEEEEALGLNSPKEKDFGEDDLQMEEAVNIIKDMILMHSSGKK